jgi:hypothetical protein
MADSKGKPWHVLVAVFKQVARVVAISGSISGRGIEMFTGRPLGLFYFRLLGQGASEYRLTKAQQAMVLQYFAMDSCARLLLLEKHVRGNEDSDCSHVLAELRQQVAQKNRTRNLQELQSRLRDRIRVLEATDQRLILWEALFQLLAEHPEEMADHAFSHTMLRMVRYGGPFVDAVRQRERIWHEARLKWWICFGTRLSDPASVYADEAAAGVPVEACLQYRIPASVD